MARFVVFMLLAAMVAVAAASTSGMSTEEEEKIKLKIRDMLKRGMGGNVRLGEEVPYEEVLAMEAENERLRKLHGDEADGASGMFMEESEYADAIQRGDIETDGSCPVGDTQCEKNRAGKAEQVVVGENAQTTA
mmetsp:Transcript_5705/g.16986  ORF Transcript_5705/g.16986 Transcript_5705/m.16986 type:complete len:134 (+) Transcript_5705:160-561(+)